MSVGFQSTTSLRSCAGPTSILGTALLCDPRLAVKSWIVRLRLRRNSHQKQGELSELQRRSSRQEEIADLGKAAWRLLAWRGYRCMPCFKPRSGLSEDRNTNCSRQHSSCRNCSNSLTEWTFVHSLFHDCEQASYTTAGRTGRSRRCNREWPCINGCESTSVDNMQDEPYTRSGVARSDP